LPKKEKVKWQHTYIVALDQAIIQLLLCYSLCHDFEDNRRIWRIRHNPWPEEQRSYQLFASEPIGFSAQTRVFSHIVHVHTMAVLPIEIDIVQLLGDVYLTDFDSF